MSRYLRRASRAVSRHDQAVFAGLLVILVAVRLLLILGVPKMYQWAPYDDLYFAHLAHYLIHGQWLGPYDQFTLIKAPFYGFFLAASPMSGLPPLLNAPLFYLG